MSLMTSRPQGHWKPQNPVLPFLSLGLFWAGLTAALPNKWTLPASAQPAVDRSNSSLRQQSQMFLFVNPAIGQDDTGSGSQQSPFRTITHALAMAQPHTVILLSPGLYSAETGEVFPLQMRSGINLQGDLSTAGQGIVIRGGGEFVSQSEGSQNVALIGTSNALLAGVTVTNPQGHALWVESSNPTIAHNTFSGSQQSGVRITGNSLAAVQQNRFRQNRGTGLSIAGSAQPEVRQNRFEQTEVGITIAGSAAPLIVQNQMSRNRTGVLVQDRARPVLRQNAIESNSEAGVVALGEAQPDLGTAEDAGQNQFRDNRRQDVDAARTTQTVPLAGNQFADRQVAGRVDWTGAMPQPANQTVAQSTIRSAEPSSAPLLNQASAHASTSAMAANRSSTLIASALIGQLPPNQVQPNQVQPDRSMPAVPSAAPLPETPLFSRANRFSPQSRSAAAEIAAVPAAVSIPIPVPLPENARVQGRVALGSTRLEPSLPAPPAADPALTAAVPISVPFRAPQPFAASELATRSGIPSGIPVMRSSLSLPAPPPVAQLAAAPVPLSSAGDRPLLQANVLPVPDGDAPIGDTGDMPRINVSAGQSWNPEGSMYSPEQLRSMLRYRVVVEATSERIQAMVRSLIPSAFLISGRGRPLMQVGAFSDRDNAEDAVRLLNQNGLRAVIQRLQ